MLLLIVLDVKWIGERLNRLLNLTIMWKATSRYISISKLIIKSASHSASDGPYVLNESIKSSFTA